MLNKRLKEILGIVLIGDGLVGLLQSRRHTSLWRGGPKPYRHMMDELVSRPILSKSVGAALVGIGFWLVSKQRAD
jgi:hypothetical protein